MTHEEQMTDLDRRLKNMEALHLVSALALLGVATIFMFSQTMKNFKSIVTK